MRMSTKEAYKQKIEAEVDLAKAKLAELKAQAASSAADARIEYAEQCDELEQKVNEMQAKLSELIEASEDTWLHLKGSIENSWHDLSTAVRRAAAKFKK
jgi:benzoyl-CoA reductase/2-hydroxyglutaryl-CoA dehydratase subunit BcrC/BadD/HgdB